MTSRAGHPRLPRASCLARSRCERSWRVGALVATLALALLTLGAAAPWAGAAGVARGASAPVPVWAPLPIADGGSWTVHDVAAFGEDGLALAGDGHVALSTDGGATWKVVVPKGYQGTAFTSVAFNTAGRGIIASGGLLLVTADWGETWAPPAFAGPGPTGSIDDVALRGGVAVAVGGGGMILASSDAGATWQLETSPATGTLTSVAIAGDGTVVAGSDAGEIRLRNSTWALAGSVGAPVTGVAAAAAVTWGDGQPDLFVATGHDVLGCDDGATFAPVAGLPDLSAASWPLLAWAGRPDRALLVAGSPDAGFFGPGTEWVSAATGLGAPVRAAAPGAQSVAYLLDAGGALVRTLSAGREPAALGLSKRRVTVGSSTRLSATVRIAAPGALLVRSRLPGGSWSTARTISWSAADWQRQVQVTLQPSLTHDYTLAFRYGGTTTQVAPVLRVTVVPRMTTSKARYDLHRGQVFRFSGSVSPQLSGERVELYTDRGGRWRPVSLQPSVKLRSGRTWTSRLFGTPKAETYHLRAHLKSTSRHAEAWSRVVTVSIH